FTCLAANSSSRPSPITTYVGFLPNLIFSMSNTLPRPCKSTFDKP
ncbi:unnamed protein product, partial [Rotaria sp. Silwood2]